jgi:hypothetical protein
MQLPTLRNSVPASLNGQSIEDFIKNSTAALQRMAEAMPGSGIAGAAYLNFNGKTGIWTLNKDVVEPESLGCIVVPQHGLYEWYIEWAGGQPLQKSPPRQLLGVHYDEPLSERVLTKPLSPHAYRKENDGPTYTLGFAGLMLDDGANVVYEGSSNGAKKAFNSLATTSTQALAAFGEIVHEVIKLGVGSWDGANGTIYEPKLNVVGYITNKRANEVAPLTDQDIVTRPTASRAKLRRETAEAPAI